jgi:hypothetical protein
MYLLDDAASKSLKLVAGNLAGKVSGPTPAAFRR